MKRENVKDLLYLIPFSYKNKKYCKVGISNNLSSRINFLKKEVDVIEDNIYYFRISFLKGFQLTFNIEQYLLKITPSSKEIENLFKGKVSGYTEIREYKYFQQLKRNILHLPVLMPNLQGKMKKLKVK